LDQQPDKDLKSNGDMVGGREGLRAGAGDHQNVHFIYLHTLNPFFSGDAKKNGTAGRMRAVSGYDKTENE